MKVHITPAELASAVRLRASRDDGGAQGLAGRIIENTINNELAYDDAMVAKLHQYAYKNRGGWQDLFEALYRRIVPHQNLQQPKAVFGATALLPVLRPVYDPRLQGARCDTCALGPDSPFLTLSNPSVKKRRGAETRSTRWKPVNDELHPGGVLAVGSYPKPEDEKEGRPMVGQSGGELLSGLAAFGVNRQHLSYTNAIACVPSGDDLDFLNHKVAKHNREIRKLAEGQGRANEPCLGHADPTLRYYEPPASACRPRLLNLARNYSDLLLLGSTALKAIVDPDASIMELRGGPVTVAVHPDGSLHREGEHAHPQALHRWRVLPTVDPSFVKRYRRWRPTFVADLARAVRFFSRGPGTDPKVGKLSWREPVIVVPTTPAQIRAFLNSGRTFQVVDIETLPGEKLDFGAPISDLPRDIQMALDADPDKDMADLSIAASGGKKRKAKKPVGEKKERRAALDVLRAKVDRVGIGDADLVYVIQFISVEDGRHFFPPHQEEEIWRDLRDFFINPNVVKGGWHLNYDIGVTSRPEYAGVRMMPRRDGIYDHHLADSELPHNLGYVASLFEDAPAWKAAHQATQTTTDAERNRYCGFDVAIEARVIKRLVPIVTSTGQDNLVELDHRKGDVCMDLHKIGMGVDQRVRQELEDHFREEAKKWLYEAARLCGKEVELDAQGQVTFGFNANSGAQVAKVLYDEWGLTVYEYTDKGEPSTSSECLIKLFVDPDVARLKNGRAFIRAVRKVRSTSKKRGTYIWPARLMSQGGHVWPDGRIRVNWGAHTVPSGRFNCGEPMNLQACPIPMRVMFIPAANCPDCIAAGRSGQHVYVMCDMDQLELRVSTGKIQCRFYLDCFAQGWDPHGLLAEVTYGDVYRNADGYVDPKTGKKPAKKSTADRLRDLIKRVVYSSLYLALLPTVHRIITEAENQDEELIYADFTVQQATLVYDGFHERAPEFRKHGEKVVAEWKQTGFVRSAILGRIRACRDAVTGEDEINTLVNHEIQCVPGWTRVLTREGYVPIETLQGKRFEAWTGKRWAPATAFQKGEAELLDVWTDRAPRFQCDASHRFLMPAERGARVGHAWREATKLGHGQRMALDLARPLEFGTAENEEDSYMIGLWLADGSISQECFAFAVGNDPTDGRGGPQQVARIQRWLKAKGLKSKVEHGQGCVKITSYVGGDLLLRSWGIDLSWRAASKRIPERIWRASLDARRAFLRGFLDGDGYAGKNLKQPVIVINLCQRPLLEDLWLLARTVGIDGGIYGPYASDRDGHQSWRLRLQKGQTFEALQWGEPGRLKTRELAPWWVCQEATKLLPKRKTNEPAQKGRTRSEDTLAARLRNKTKARVSPYVLRRFGLDDGRLDLYDYVRSSAARPRRARTPVYTLSVDDPDHQYVAAGFISKNSGGRDAVDIALLKLVERYPLGFAGRNTGLVLDGHDALMFEVPIEMALEVRDDLTKTMTQDFPQLPGVTLSAEADIALRWAPLTCKACGGNRDMKMQQFKPPSAKNKYCGPECGKSVVFD